MKENIKAVTEVVIMIILVMLIYWTLCLVFEPVIVGEVMMFLAAGVIGIFVYAGHTLDYIYTGISRLFKRKKK
jgi:TctA family transporter